MSLLVPIRKSTTEQTRNLFWRAPEIFGRVRNCTPPYHGPIDHGYEREGWGNGDAGRDRSVADCKLSNLKTQKRLMTPHPQQNIDAAIFLPSGDSSAKLAAKIAIRYFSAIATCLQAGIVNALHEAAGESRIGVLASQVDMQVDRLTSFRYTLSLT